MPFRWFKKIRKKFRKIQKWSERLFSKIQKIIMILPKRGRWRPKSKDILLSEKETAAWELFTAMESYEYKYDDIIKEISKKINSQKLKSVWCNATEIINFRRKHKRTQRISYKIFWISSFWWITLGNCWKRNKSAHCKFIRNGSRKWWFWWKSSNNWKFSL